MNNNETSPPQDKLTTGAIGSPVCGVKCSAAACDKNSWRPKVSLRPKGRWKYELEHARGRLNNDPAGWGDPCSEAPLLYRQTCMFFTAKLNLT